MSKELCISSTPHETRLAIIEDDQLTEIYYERENEYTLAGSIYKGRVTRVLPGMQSAFVDIGLERDAFLYVTDFLEEQGESADFEKSTQTGGRERQPQREGREPRAPRPPREVGEGRLAVEPSAATSPDAPSASTPRAASGEAAAPQDEFDQGTRRWRGRRGRRRSGVRTAPREGSAASPQDASAEVDLDAALLEDLHHQPEQPFEAHFEAAPGIPLSAQADPADTSFGNTPASTRSSGREGGRRDNSRRDSRNEGRRDSRPAFHNEDSRHESHAEAAPSSGQPIFLPGESLSKYGQKPPVFTIEIEAVDRSDEKPLPIITTARPSTLVEGTLAWDGISSALPGESLSKHRSRTPAEPVPSVAPTTVHAYQPVADFTPTHPHSGDADASHAAPLEILHAVQTPEGISFEDIEPHVASGIALDGQAHPEAGHHAEPVVEPHHTPAPIPTEPAPLLPETEFATEEQEFVPEVPSETNSDFEPDHASASYRVDPTAPSEFRMPAPVEEPLQYQQEEPSQHQQEEPSQHPDVPHVEAGPDEAAGPTTQPTAEDKWDWQQPAPAIQAATASETHPDSGQHALDEEEVGNHHLDQVRAFSPGTGLLEEEVIDEDEYDFTPLHAHADDHDLEEIEEETLDSALVGSQLGDFVRDEHIKRRVMGDSDDDDLLSESDEEAEDDFSEEAEGEFTEEDFSGPAHDEEHGGESSHEGEAAFTHETTHTARTVEEAGTEGRTERAPRRDDQRRREGGRDNGRGGRRGNNGQRGRSGHRQSAQTSDLPIISDLLKQGQEVLIQIAKEPIAKKGARITSHIALPGRFLVFMPTVNHVGVSRKISSDEERHRLKRVLSSEKGTAPGGFIVRTAAEGASEEELRADLRFLISLWTEIKTRSDAGKAPALIYHDLNLVERVLRDQVSDNFSTIWVDSEVEYERIVRFLNRFEPSLVRRVKLYTKETPLFEQFGIQDEISKALKSKVWLKSGGSIVINQTEALVAIDINTGKYVGKTARLEDTIVKTNLDAIPEIVRQIRLRDLGGIIIIDFIDMDERKNRHKVMAALEEELKSDRAPSKVLQFNDFGLVAITRKRVKQSLERTLSTQCNICAGTGMVKSPVTVCNEIYTELRKMMKHFERGDVLLRVNPEIVKTLKLNNGKWLTELEEMIGRTIMIKSDPALHPEQFDIH